MLTKGKPSNRLGPAALTRILRLHQRLADGNAITAKSLADELEVSIRTIKRDVERLRDFHGAPIVWDAALHSYKYTHPCHELPLLHFTTAEALALALANETFVAWRGSALGNALTSAFKKMGGALGDKVTFSTSDLGTLVSVASPGGEAASENRHFPKVLEATIQKKTLSFVYRKPHEPPEERLVYPLHLARMEHRWVLISWDPSRENARRFLLSRMDQVSAGEEYFEVPSAFNLTDHLRGSFGLYNGQEPTNVRLRFDAYAAPFIRERTWHPSQKLFERTEGSVELQLQVNHLLDVRRWVLSWGRHVEALEPEKLRDEIREELAELTKNYQE